MAMVIETWPVWLPPTIAFLVAVVGVLSGAASVGDGSLSLREKLRGLPTVALGLSLCVLTVTIVLNARNVATENELRQNLLSSLEDAREQRQLIGDQLQAAEEGLADIERRLAEAVAEREEAVSQRNDLARQLAEASREEMERFRASNQGLANREYQEFLEGRSGALWQFSAESLFVFWEEQEIARFGNSNFALTGPGYLQLFSPNCGYQLVFGATGPFPSSGNDFGAVTGFLSNSRRNVDRSDGSLASSYISDDEVVSVLPLSLFSGENCRIEYRFYSEVAQ